jgi:hypothetical protein
MPGDFHVVSTFLYQFQSQQNKPGVVIAQWYALQAA